MGTGGRLSAKLAVWGPEKVAFTGIALLVTLSVVSVGGVLFGAILALGGLAAASALATHAASSQRRRFIAPAALVLLLLAIYSALQAAPLPLGWLERFSPRAADIWARCTLAAGETTPQGSISLAPGASLIEACKWATYACTFQLAATLGRFGKGRTLLQLVLGVATLVALLTVGHHLLGAKSVLGLYTPKNDFKPHGVGPLLNPNHLAGYCNLGTLVGLGVSLDPNPRAPRWLVGTGSVVCLAVGLQSASRGGALALLAGVLVLGVLVGLQALLRKHERHAPSRAALAVVAGVLVTGIGLAAIGYDAGLAQELTDQGMGKLALASWTPSLFRDFFPFGVGRGAFESVFSAYRPPLGTHQVFTHPENLIAQWATEWGVLGLAALATLAWMLRPTRLAVMRSPSYAGAAAAASALLLHNLVDYSLELAGPAIALTALLGVLAEGGRPRRSKRELGSTWPSVGGAALVLTALAAWGGAPTLADARSRVRDAVVERQPEAGALIVAMCRRFPADFYFPMMGAALAETKGDNPIPWIQRALERGPAVGRTHLLLAQVLGERGLHSQALLELKLALSMENGIHVAAAQAASRWPVTPAAMLEVAPDGAYGPVTVDAFVTVLIEKGRQSDAQALDRLALERFPESISIRSRVVEARSAELGTPRCDAACTGELIMHADELSTRFPESSAGEVLRARVALSKGDAASARDGLREACKKPEGAVVCLRQLASIEEPDQLGPVVARMLVLECVSRSRCAAANDWAADVYAERQQWAQAFGAAQRAVREEPSDTRRTRATTLGQRAGVPASPGALMH